MQQQKRSIENQPYDETLEVTIKKIKKIKINLFINN